MSVTEYRSFIDRKSQSASRGGFDPIDLPESLFPFQRDLTAWAIDQGRAAIFADCGVGKTAMQLVWADNVHRHTGQPVLVLTPLAVAPQTIREAEKFSIEATRSIDGTVAGPITVTNYERLNKFDPDDFAGVVCDESSILKSFDGARRSLVIDFMRKVPYRLLATATAAPNDYIELGNSSEALGHLGHMDMLGRFFKNDQNNCSTKRLYGEAPKWRLKGHAEVPFWRWVTSWARACRKPSDLGFDDAGFILPELTEQQRIVEYRGAIDGYLFHLPAVGLKEQREERKRTVQQRCERAAELVDHSDPAIIWCHLNDEGDLLEQLIPGAVQVSGSDSEAKKEERLTGFADGDIRVLVTKPKIGAWGLNFQRCAHVVYFPSHSYEQYYQAVRRCWRFGQERPVQVDIVLTEGDKRVMENLQRKSIAADQMFDRLIDNMNDSIRINRLNEHGKSIVKPQWLREVV